jgi:chemotaxis protein MotB
MSKKKHPEHVNHERWLVSYADFITLLFAFFVVLFASSQADKKKQSQLAAAMQTAFTPMGIFDAHSKTPALMPDSASSLNATPAPLQPPIPTVADFAAQEAAATATRIAKLLKEEKTISKLHPDSITMRLTPEGLVISLREAGFFPSGSAEVDASSLPLLWKLAATLPMSRTRVEGHTDNVPIHTAQFASNWELSTSRATAIARIVLEHSTVSPADLSAAGYAEYHPIASNATTEGRAQNRRVDIILLRSPAPSR